MKKGLSMRAMTILFLGLSLSTAPSLAFAKGGKDGGGADYVQNPQAWFLSSDPGKRIRACAEVAPGFSVPKDEITTAIRESFRKWGEIIRRDGVNAKMVGAGVGSVGGNGEAAYYHHDLRLVTDVDLAFGCRGNEDLRFLFGVKNAEIEKRKLHYQMPFAFSETNQSVDPNGSAVTWTPGFVWVAPDRSVMPKFEIPTWTSQDYHPFRQLLLHEIGHIMGVGHVDGTVMGMQLMNDLAERTQRGATARQTGNHYGRRDLEIERYSSLYVAPDFETDLVLPERTAAAVFKRLTGRAPFGKVTAHAKRADAKSDSILMDEGRLPGDVTLTITDGLGKVELVLHEKMLVAVNRNRSAAIFKTPTWSQDFLAYSFAGTLTTATGEKMDVVSNYNQNYCRYEIRDLGQMKDIPAGGGSAEDLLISDDN